MPTFSITGSVWVVELEHTETESIEGVLGAIAAAAGPSGPIVSAAVGAAAAIILFMDALGGDHGVEVTGVLYLAGTIVMPRNAGFAGTLVHGALTVVDGATTIVDFILKSAGASPKLAEALGLAIVAGPIGIGIAIAELLSPSHDPNEHGGVRGDRRAIGNWEKFTLVHLPNASNEVTLLSWQGLFSAQGGGGSSVFANRPKVGPWETWALLHNANGTVSLQSVNGHYLTALGGGGDNSTCYSDRTAIGTWEMFYLEPLPGGQIAIKTHDRQTYLSVQDGQ